MMNGVFDANTDVSRWRAAASKAADILDKLAKVDYTVPGDTSEQTWDAWQNCEGEIESVGRAPDLVQYYSHRTNSTNNGTTVDATYQPDFAQYSTNSEAACEAFNLNSVGTPGFGRCRWVSSYYYWYQTR